MTQDQLEELRYEVRRYLYARPGAAMSADAIRHGLSLWGHKYEVSHVTNAAAFLAGLDPAEVKVIPASLGATPHYQITSAGSLAHERSQV